MKSQIIYNPFRHYLPRVHISFVLHTTASFPFLRNWFFYCSSLPLFFLRFLFLKAQNLFSLSFLTHLRFLQIQPIPSSPGTHPFCLFSFTSHSSTVSLIRFSPSFALYAIPAGLILRFLTQSLRFYCCSCNFDCGGFSSSSLFLDELCVLRIFRDFGCGSEFFGGVVDFVVGCFGQILWYLLMECLWILLEFSSLMCCFLIGWIWSIEG